MQVGSAHRTTGIEKGKNAYWDLYEPISVVWYFGSTLKGADIGSCSLADTLCNLILDS